MSNQDHYYTLILAGGGGTRLWPKSRKELPKQFLSLNGEGTMIQVTAERFAKLVGWEKIIVVTTKAYQHLVEEQLPKVPRENIIAEPEKRDTAMAMLTGALFAMSKDPEAILINDAADHVIVDEKEFLRLMELAAEVSSDYEHLVAVGITPTFPSTAFGYIKVGEEWKKMGRDSIFKVANFTEKPNEATARAFISSGKYFWNANHYVWSAKALVNAFERYMPAMLSTAEKLIKAQSTKEFVDALPEAYQQAESISVDYAISEKADNLLLIPGDFGWDDIGEWKVVYDLADKDTNKNAVLGEGEKKTVLVNSSGNLIHTDKRLVATVGLDNMIVVDTGEILLICPQSQSQNVKKIVEQLKKDNHTEYL